MKQEVRWVFLDSLRRRLYLKYEIKRQLCHALRHNTSVRYIPRILWSYKTSNLPIIGHRTRHQRRCAVTGRALAVSRHWRVSRFVLRNSTDNGMWPGVNRASW